jgi:hypothetical protein
MHSVSKLPALISQLTLLSSISIMLSNCAIGTTIDLRKQSIGLAAYSSAEMPASFRIAVHDARGEEPTRVGTLHAILPIPWPVYSESKKALADDLTDPLLTAFARSKLPAHQVSIEPTATSTEARQRTRPEAGDAGLLFTIRELWVRTWFSTSFTYDLLLEVVDSAGAVIASSEAKDSESVDDYGVEQLSGQAFSRLLGAPAIRNAIRKTMTRTSAASKETPPSTSSAAPAPPEQPQNQPAPATTSTPPSTRTPLGISASKTSPTSQSSATKKPSPEQSAKCSVEQILKMKEMGLSDAQIRSACPD